MTLDRRKFYVGIGIKDGELIGHAMSREAQTFSFEAEKPTPPVDGVAFVGPQKQSGTFEKVFNEFVALTESYMRFMPMTMRIVPQVANMLAERKVAQFARSKGTKREDLTNSTCEVYELEARFLRDFFDRHELVVQAGDGVKLLPQILIIGLISTYDAFLAALLRVVFSLQPEIVLTSQKQLTFKELMEFESIDVAREALIDREIDGVIRKSHHEQFDWMQFHLSVKLKENLLVWPRFVELCERRNLFTHTGGVVSAQYLRTCAAHKVDVSGIQIGQKLIVDAKYYKTAVHTIYEVGLKLCYVFWRKFDEKTMDDADVEFNGRCMELIRVREYELAEALLKFGCGVPKIKDNLRKMMVVNLANAVSLQERKGEAKKLLDAEDWSATSDDFKICVAAVRGDVEQVLRLMEHMGSKVTADDYRSWPVFRRLREEPSFCEKFESIFGEPIYSVKATSAKPVSESSGPSSSLH